MLENQLIPNKEQPMRVQYAETRLEPIWTCLCEILKDPDNVIPRLEEYTFKSAGLKEANKKIAEAEKNIELCKQKRSRIVKVFTDGRMSEKDYDHESKECDSSILEFNQQISKFRQLLIQQDERKDRNEILKTLYQKVKTKLDNATYEDKQFILHLFVERINLFHKSNYAEVIFKFPANLDVKIDSVKKISPETDMYLVLHVKTLSQLERQREILYSNLSLRKDTQPTQK